MRKPLFPINIWAYRENGLRLFTFCRSMDEALEFARQLPFTPVVLSTQTDLPFGEECIAEVDFDEALAQ